MRFLLFAFFLGLALNGAAQEIKRPLIHHDYDGWESIRNKRISNNGKWVSVEISLQDGDGRLHLIESVSGKKGFDNSSKSSGYFRGDWEGSKQPEELIFGEANYSGLKVARDKCRFIYQKSTYSDSPNVYASNGTFRKQQQLSHINEKQNTINWGNVELVDFLSNDGDEMKGLLFKPENFDPKKKYPMMVYF